MRHTLTIPDWHPPKANHYRGRHWSAEHKAKRACAEFIALYAAQAGIPRAISKRRVHPAITLGPRDRQPDDDAFDKVLYDALVRCGLLLDDGPALCERCRIVFWRGRRRATTIYLEDME